MMQSKDKQQQSAAQAELLIMQRVKGQAAYLLLQEWLLRAAQEHLWLLVTDVV
jgi:hypothetical protein